MYFLLRYCRENPAIPPALLPIYLAYETGKQSMQIPPSQKGKEE